VNIQLNIVICPTYPDKFTQDMLLHRLYYFTGCNCHTAGYILKESLRQMILHPVVPHFMSTFCAYIHRTRYYTFTVLIKYKLIIFVYYYFN